ncbi:MAG TPA: hypothetical protein DDW20_02910 [Firmicutes bacterium]|nr:hypothetical protein [Bacillota bacterium]
MYLYETLAKYQKGIDFKKSADYNFYVEHRHLFNSIEMYRSLFDVDNEFDVIRANIIIQALLNKKKIEELILYAYKKSYLKTEEALKFVDEHINGLPYILEGANKVFIPIFSRSINEYYSSKHGKLLCEPYNKLFDDFNSSCIDLFEVYNFELYDSLFTKLITVYKDENIMITYHFDFRTIYIINDQGRLDAKIALFDKYLNKPNYDHVIERIQPVIERYIDDDKDGMLKALADKKLISEKLINKIKHNDFKRIKALERKAR